MGWGRQRQGVLHKDSCVMLAFASSDWRQGAADASAWRYSWGIEL